MDDNTFKLWSLVIGGITPIVLAFLAYRTRRVELAAEAAARQAEQTAGRAAIEAAGVKATLAQNTDVTTGQLDALTTIATATHTLANSNFGTSLKATLNALRAVEALTTEPAAKAAARAAVLDAQRLYDDHMAKQAVVDMAARTPGGHDTQGGST